MDRSRNAQLPNAVEALVTALAARRGVRRIWLFGSRARGEAAERADVDLAIEAPGISAGEWLDLCDLVDRSETLLHVDLVDLSRADPAIAKSVARDGVVLHER